MYSCVENMVAAIDIDEIGISLLEKPHGKRKCCTSTQLTPSYVCTMLSILPTIP